LDFTVFKIYFFPLTIWAADQPLIKNRYLSIWRLVLKLLQNVQVLKYYIRVFTEIKDLNYVTLVEKFHLGSKIFTHTCFLISFNIVIRRQVVIGYSFVPLNSYSIVLDGKKKSFKDVGGEIHTFRCDIISEKWKYRRCSFFIMQSIRRYILICCIVMWFRITFIFQNISWLLHSFSLHSIPLIKL
jgi:hypothetical protein